MRAGVNFPYEAINKPQREYVIAKCGGGTMTVDGVDKFTGTSGVSAFGGNLSLLTLFTGHAFKISRGIVDPRQEVQQAYARGVLFFAGVFYELSDKLPLPADDVVVQRMRGVETGIAAKRYYSRIATEADSFCGLVDLGAAALRIPDHNTRYALLAGAGAVNHLIRESLAETTASHLEFQYPDILSTTAAAEIEEQFRAL